MTRWSEMQKRSRKLIDEGMSILKIGMHEAGFLAESTAGAARLHVEASRKRFELYRVLHDLGDELHSALKEKTAIQQIELTQPMKELVDAADELSRSLEHDEMELERFSVVKHEKGGSPKPVSPRPKRAPKVAHKAPGSGKKGTRRASNSKARRGS